MRSRQVVDTACSVTGHLPTKVPRCAAGIWSVKRASGTAVAMLSPLGLFRPGGGTTLSISSFVCSCNVVVSGRRNAWSPAGLALASSVTLGASSHQAHQCLHRSQMVGTAFSGAGSVPSLLAQLVFADERGQASLHCCVVGTGAPESAHGHTWDGSGVLAIVSSISGGSFRPRGHPNCVRQRTFW